MERHHVYDDLLNESGDPEPDNPPDYEERALPQYIDRHLQPAVKSYRLQQTGIKTWTVAPDHSSTQRAD
ncbi:hypothetical protein LTS18_007703, partial [Coniosporium uncinatum]